MPREAQDLSSGRRRSLRRPPATWPAPLIFWCWPSAEETFRGLESRYTEARNPGISGSRRICRLPQQSRRPGRPAHRCSGTSENYPDYQMFLDDRARPAIQLILFATREFAADDIDDVARSNSKTCDFTRDEQRDMRTPPARPARLRRRHLLARTGLRSTSRALRLRAPARLVRGVPDHRGRDRCPPARRRSGDDDELARRLLLQELTMAQPRWILPDLPARRGSGAGRRAGHRRPCRQRARTAAASATPTRARRFLHPSLDELHDPLSMRDMAAALERLRRAIRDGEKILIYGDYDVDGTTSRGAFSTKAIELAGGMRRLPRAAPPEGRLRHAAGSGGGGRRAGRPADRQRGYRHSRRAKWWRAPTNSGIDVIVTDHHLPEAELPPALAVLNPEPPGLRLSGKESVRRGRGVQAGAGAAGDAGLAAGQGAARHANRF